MAKGYMVEWGFADREADRVLFQSEDEARELYGSRQVDPRQVWNTERMTAGRAFDPRRTAFRELSEIALDGSGFVGDWGGVIEREEYGREDYMAED